MPHTFSITYATTTPESIEDGNYSETGFIDEACTLREAHDRLRLEGRAVETDGWPVGRPHWLSFGWYCTDYTTGEEKELTLHIPATVTTSSARRIARLFGLPL